MLYQFHFGFNTFDPKWIPSNIHCYWVVLGGNSNHRRWIVLGILHL